MEQHIIIFAGTFVLFLMGSSLLVFSVLYQRKIRSKEIENTKLKEMLQDAELESLISIQEKLEAERMKISEDIHHHLGGLLAQLNFTWAQQAHQLPEQEGATMTNLIREVLGETKKVSNALYMLSKIGNLNTMVTDLAEKTRHLSGITVEFSPNEINSLEIKTSRQIFRMIQEMVSNTLKYAQATKISLEISQPEEDQISIIYFDNGIGFDPDTTKYGMGLDSIQTIAANYDGSFELETGKNGTTIAILLKL